MSNTKVRILKKLSSQAVNNTETDVSSVPTVTIEQSVNHSGNIG